jgi:hypothetical protein
MREYFIINIENNPRLDSLRPFPAAGFSLALLALNEL